MAVDVPRSIADLEQIHHSNDNCHWSSWWWLSPSSSVLIIPIVAVLGLTEDNGGSDKFDPCARSGIIYLCQCLWLGAMHKHKLHHHVLGEANVVARLKNCKLVSHHFAYPMPVQLINLIIQCLDIRTGGAFSEGWVFGLSNDSNEVHSNCDTRSISHVTACIIIVIVIIILLEHTSHHRHHNHWQQSLSLTERNHWHFHLLRIGHR